MPSFWNRINTVLLLIILTGGTLALASRALGGPLDPAGPPGSTLPQVEPRVPLPPVGWNGTDPIMISQSGSYFLTRNVAITTGNAIVIDANDVTMDLNGFAITAPATNTGIAATGTVRTGVVIRNGHVRGFGVGVNVPSLSRSRLEDLEVEGALAVGIVVGSGGSVLNVLAHDNVNVGLNVIQQGTNYGTLIADSNFSRNGFGSQATTSGVTISANNVWLRNSIIDANEGPGVRISLGASYNQVTDNRITGNSGPGVLVNSVGTTDLASYFNMIARNVIVFNSPAVVDQGISTHVGTFVGGDASITATNPWSNAVY